MRPVVKPRRDLRNYELKNGPQIHMRKREPEVPTIIRCRCGRVTLEATGAPIISLACYCDDCQEGGRRLDALADAPPAMEPDGSTEYVLYRKDRFTCAKGAELLESHKLRDDSPTNRVVATCCNAAMHLSFDGGPHWVSVFRRRFERDAPPLAMRLNTRFAPQLSRIPDDVPRYASFPLRFPAKLIAARIAMLLRRGRAPMRGA